LQPRDHRRRKLIFQGRLREKITSAETKRLFLPITRAQERD
jgi:hypothetical protein